MAQKIVEKRKQHPMQRLLDKNYSARLKITIFILSMFVLTISGIILAIYSDTSLDQAWKEILLVLVGAFIGAFTKAIDFWFNVERDQEIIRRADFEDDEVTSDTPPNK